MAALSRARLGWRGAEHTNRSWHVVGRGSNGGKPHFRLFVACMLQHSWRGLGGLSPSASTYRKLRERQRGGGEGGRGGTAAASNLRDGQAD